MGDPISDMLIRIKNAQMAKHEQVLVPFSKIKFEIANILKRSGYINEVERKKDKSKKTEHDYLLLTLKYSNNQAEISGIRTISKQSRRLYIKSKDIKPVRSGYGIIIISTPKGLMESKEAKKNNLGGEILCEVW